MPSVEERLRYWRDRATTAEVENATLSAENAALTERLERVDGLVTRAKSIVPRWYEDWHACAEPPSHGRGSE